MTIAERVKAILWDEIRDMSDAPGGFAKNPDVDFTRKRKLDFENLMRFIVSMQSGTTNHELLKYFNFDPKTISSSAFYQQRIKLLPTAFPYLLKQFNLHFPFDVYRGVYNLIGCDGCEFNIARNPDDLDTFHPSNGTSTRGFNMLHTISLYDLLNKRFLDCVIQPGRKKNEFQAICDLTDRYSYGGIPIFIADRGFSCYNYFAHASEKGILFVVRAKDMNTKRLLKLDSLPDSIDSCVDIILSRTQSKKKMKHPDLADHYRYICPDVQFDYIKPSSDDEYSLSLRIVRFEVTDGIFENIVTNLPPDEFPPEQIKHLYNIRWGIETSFRNLKHILGTRNFHSKKVECIKQEIWARLILFNFCAVITTNSVIKIGDTKHVYQVNFTMALKICHHFIRLSEHDPPLDVEALIGSFTQPIRFERNFARQHRFQLPTSFWYKSS